MEIIREFQRTLLSRLGEKPRFIQVVLGPRQVGKTTGVKNLLQQLTNNSNRQAHFESADQPSAPTTAWIEEQWRIARSLPAGSVLAIDEIQKIPRWSEVIKRLFDQDRSKAELHIVLLGSASLAIEQGLTESLTGRFELIRVPHWDLFESKEAFDWDLETFLQFGGYPAPAVLVETPERWQSFVRDSILEPVISRDISLIHRIGNPALFRQCLELALHYPAQEVSYNKLLGQLQENGNASTIKHYIELLEGAFLIRKLEKFSKKPLKIKSSSPKLIPLAPALISAFGSPSRVLSDRAWRGRVFEAAIGAKLSTVYRDLYYWREGNNEVDFVCLDEGQVIGLEVKSQDTSLERNSLEVFRSKFPGSIVTKIDERSGATILATADPRLMLRKLASR